ncbi:CDP-alcohol phosphatidyltransferase family protein [Atopobium fossor]|uniref:CDP-alcohol phosphatidyltransferase family protein n=1 Tax=Atopobium fossor TaxID=39487 RepID=UPI000419D41B|nr:CDP-alcohol phosphatidyltransferase family protein [Atopobium fossor]
MAKNRQIKERVKNNLKNKADYDALTAQQTGHTTSPVGTPDNPSTRIFTLANAITFTRLIFTLIFLYIFVTGENRYIALLFYATAAITDFLDGQVARRTQTVSWVGKIMDPIMDRVLLFTGVLGLVLTKELPLWTAIFVIGRDAYLGIGAQILQKYRRRPVDVILIGKITTALLMFGFTDLLLGLPMLQSLRLVKVDWLPLLNGTQAPLGMLAVYAGIVCSVITAIIYTKTGISIIRSSRLDQKEAASHV